MTLTEERTIYVDARTLCEKVAQLEQQAKTDKETYLFAIGSLTQRVSEQADTLEKQGFVIAALEQQVRDLTADLARHEATPHAHTRYEFSTLGEVVLCGLETALDYDPRDQMDVPITDDAQTDGLMLVDSELTDDQRNRIWQRVQAETNGDGNHAA